MKLGRIFNREVAAYAKNFLKFAVGSWVMLDGYGRIMADLGERFGYQKHVNETYTDAVNKQISRYSGDKGDRYILGLDEKQYNEFVELGKGRSNSNEA